MHFLLNGIRFGGQKSKEKRALVGANKSRMKTINGRKPSNKAASNSNQGNLQWNSWWHVRNPLTEQEQNPEKPAENRRQPVREQYNQLKHNKNLGRETDTREKSAQTMENDLKKREHLRKRRKKGKNTNTHPKKNTKKCSSCVF